MRGCDAAVARRGLCSPTACLGLWLQQQFGFSGTDGGSALQGPFPGSRLPWPFGFLGLFSTLQKPLLRESRSLLRRGSFQNQRSGGP